MPNLREAYLRHANYYLEVAKLNTNNYQKLLSEQDNIVLGLSTCLEYQEWKLLSSYIYLLGDFWIKRGSWLEYKKYANLLLDRDVVDDINQRIKLLSNISSIEELSGNYEQAWKLSKLQIQIMDEAMVVDEAGLDLACQRIVRIAKSRGDYQEAIRFLNRRLSNVQNYTNRKEEVDICVDLSNMYLAVSNLTEANLNCQRGLEISRNIGYSIGLIDLLITMTIICDFKKESDLAIKTLEEAMSLATKAGDRQRIDTIKKVEISMKKRVFISYNRNDLHFVKKLATDLINKGLLVWWDEWEIKVGDSIVEKVSNGIKSSAYLAVVLSPNSVQSTWVNKEVNSATMRQLSEKRSITILPILIADCEIPVFLVDVKWADFRSDYRSGFKDLLKKLL